MPTQDNCEDLQVESCVDENGQTIQGGDSYAVPTGRYVKHVVNVCGSGGAAAGGLKTTACPDGGLEETWSGPDEVCLSIKTEDDNALVLDNGVLKIDSTKLKVTSDNVLPAGTDPGLLSTGPLFTDPDGNVWDNQSDYNKWLYEQQKRQDGEIENITDSLDDYVLKTEFEKDQERQDNELDKLTEEIEEIKDTLGTSCDSPELTGTLGTTINDDLVWHEDGGTVHDPIDDWQLRITQEVHQNQWDAPDHDDYPEQLTINGESYKVKDAWTSDSSTYYYWLAEGSLDHLVGQEITISQCSSDGGNFVEKTGDTMSGDLEVNANVIADKVVSRIIDSGENSNLEFKHDGNTKVYVGKEQLTSQEKLKLNKEGTEDYHAVTKGYIDTDQKRQDDALEAEIVARAERDLLHDAQLSTLEYKLDALVGLQFKGIYEFKHENDCNLEYERCVENCMNIDPQDHECRQMCGYNQMDCERDKVRPGYFEAVDPDDRFDHLEYIVISKADKAGVEIDWAGVLDEGDYLEVDHTADGVLDKTNYGLYRITEEPEHGSNAYGEDVYTIRVQFLQGDGVMNVRENYEIRGITAAEGVNPEELGDFLTKDEAAATYATKGHSHSNYASSNHTHSNYASSSHTHSGYASSSHTHSGYASSSHNHNSTYVKGNYTISYSSGSYYIS